MDLNSSRRYAKTSIGVGSSFVVPIRSAGRSDVPAHCAEGSLEIVFALANPDPEISPQSATPHCRVYASGRSDYPNQCNNLLAFPGLFRGSLDIQAKTINEPMLLAVVGYLSISLILRLVRQDYFYRFSYYLWPVGITVILLTYW